MREVEKQEGGRGRDSLQYNIMYVCYSVMVTSDSFALPCFSLLAIYDIHVCTCTSVTMSCKLEIYSIQALR